MSVAILAKYRNTTYLERPPVPPFVLIPDILLLRYIVM